MALQITFNDQYGNINPVSYWRIQQLSMSLEAIGGSAVIGIVGYKDKEARNNGKVPIETLSMLLEDGPFDELLSAVINGNPNALTTLYDQVKLHEFTTLSGITGKIFENAINV